MSVTSDSIQTLLQQRRDLRSCLQELRDEIASIHQTADSMIDRTLADRKKISMPAPDLKVVPASVEETQLAVPSPLPLPDTGPEEAQVATDIPVAATPKSPVQASDQKAEPVLRAAFVEADFDETEKKPENGNDLLSGEMPDHGEDADITVDMTEREEVPDIEELLKQAILLAGFFLHHPSAAGNKSLDDLDQAIRSIQALPASAQTQKAMVALKDAYRNVVSLTFSEARVNGQSLSDSTGPVTILWMLPMAISALILAVFPGLLLLRSMAGQMGGGGFAIELDLLLGVISAFIWGMAGGLGAIAILIAHDVNKRRYIRGHMRDMGLRAVLGGIFGIATFMGLTVAGILSGVLADALTGLAAFGAGGVSCWLVSLFHKARRGQKKTGHPV